MYQAAQPTYQGNWQPNHYTDYQHMRHPQHYYYNNNSYYNNGYYNGSNSSNSSSMDSLNDPYYYSHPMMTNPQVHNYRQIPSPGFLYYSHSSSPTYSSSLSPTYSPPSPSYSPTGPYIQPNSFRSVKPRRYNKATPVTSNKLNDDEKTQFHIGMKPTERLQWIREAFPKQVSPTMESSLTPWELVAPVKPLRRPHKSTIKK